jgi:hypothetical protein
VHCGIRVRGLAEVGLAILAFGWALSSHAQVALGDLHATGSGWLETLYNGSYGNFEGDEHSLGFAGRGQISGDYYNPNFLSFTVLPYYGRSQDNSDSQSITNASGYDGVVNLFKGSNFPGIVSFDQAWNNSGTFGVPGLAGLTTVNNSHAFGVGWSALMPGLPTFSIGYSDSGGTSSLLGSESTTASTTKNFNLGSTYKFGGYYFTAGFIHLSSDISIGGLADGVAPGAADGLTETSNNSSNQYHATAQGPIPYRTSSMNFGFSRSDFADDDSLSGRGSSTADTANANVNIQFPKAPVSFTAIYTDNILGNFEQQLLANGQTPLETLGNSASHSLSVGATTFVNVLPRLMVGGYVDRTEQYFEGQSSGLTQVGLTLNYNFFQKLKGLVIYAGLFDNATQQGNSHLGMIGNVSYHKDVGKWVLNGFVLYDQDVQTLLVQYTTSTLNYGGSIKREITPDLRWANVANVVRSVFEQTSGDSSSGESFTSMLIWKKASISGFYSKSRGVSILTATGLVSIPIPTQAISSSNLVLYNGSNYGGSTSIFPIKAMAISMAWSRSLGNMNSPQLLSNNGSTNIYGFMTYQFRKLLFQAGVTKFNQNISSSGLPPTMLTSYSFGVSRWFKGF